MFDGRHCTYQDLELLKKETNKIRLLVAQNDFDYKLLLEFVRFIERFDEGIASKMRFQFECADKDVDKIKTIIESNVDTIVQSVIVDINEHHD